MRQRLFCVGIVALWAAALVPLLIYSNPCH